MRTLFWILWTLYLVGIAAYLVGVILNVRITHTYEYPPGAPGMLKSERFFNGNTLTWWWLFVASWNILFPFVLLLLVGASRGSSYGWLLFLLLMLFVLIVADVASLAHLGVQYADCNQNGSMENLCHDRNYCCVFYTDAINMCPNTTPCTTVTVTAADLRPDPLFLGAFWAKVAFVVLDLALLFLVIWGLYGSGAVRPNNNNNKKGPYGIIGRVVSRKPKKIKP